MIHPVSGRNRPSKSEAFSTKTSCRDPPSSSVSRTPHWRDDTRQALTPPRPHPSPLQFSTWQKTLSSRSSKSRFQKPGFNLETRKLECFRVARRRNAKDHLFQNKCKPI